MAEAMRKVPKSQWPSGFRDCSCPAIEVWRDLDFLAILYPVPEAADHQRLTVCRSSRARLVDGKAVWRDGITWDDLMLVKARCGFADRWAVEVYPPDAEVVNVANMRHLWLLPQAPNYVWRKNRG